MADFPISHRAAPFFWRDPALPFVESRRAVRSRACYRPHTHPTLSIGAVDAGYSLFSSRGHSARIVPGSLVVVPAGCVHSCNPEPGAHWSYQMLHLDPAWVASVLGRHGAGAPPDGHAWVVHDAAAYAAFCALNQQLFSAASLSHKTKALEQFVVRRVWNTGQALASIPEKTLPTLHRVLHLLHRHHAEPLPVAQLAQIAHMAPRTLARTFLQATGLTLHAYQLDLRVHAARQLLSAGGTAAQVAQELGFYDQSHFQTTFKQRVAATPGLYQRTCAA